MVWEKIVVVDTLPRRRSLELFCLFALQENLRLIRKINKPQRFSNVKERSPKIVRPLCHQRKKIKTPKFEFLTIRIIAGSKDLDLPSSFITGASIKFAPNITSGHPLPSCYTNFYEPITFTISLIILNFHN